MVKLTLTSPAERSLGQKSASSSPSRNSDAKKPSNPMGTPSRMARGSTGLRVIRMMSAAVVMPTA